MPSTNAQEEANPSNKYKLSVNQTKRSSRNLKVACTLSFRPYGRLSHRYCMKGYEKLLSLSFSMDTYGRSLQLHAPLGRTLCLFFAKQCRRWSLSILFHGNGDRGASPEDQSHLDCRARSLVPCRPAPTSTRSWNIGD